MKTGVQSDCNECHLSNSRFLVHRTLDNKLFMIIIIIIYRKKKIFFTYLNAPAGNNNQAPGWSVSIRELIRTRVVNVRERDWISSRT